MALTDARLARILRDALNAYAMTDTLIATLIHGELKETGIASSYPDAVTNLKNQRFAFAANLQNALLREGAIWLGNVYSLGTQMSFGFKLVATEECPHCPRNLKHIASSSGISKRSGSSVTASLRRHGHAEPTLRPI